MASERPVIMWFRQDLRLKDNRALRAAAATGAPLIALYILDDEACGTWRPGGASRWWLHHSLAALAESLDARGVPLVLRRGATLEIMDALATETDAEAVYFTRCYDPFQQALETRLNDTLNERGVTCRRHTGRLLYEPTDIRTSSGEPYKVFTPYWKACLRAGEPARPIGAPDALEPWRGELASDALGDWRLTPTRPDWAGGLREAWTPGEAGAEKRLADFLGEHLDGYKDMRDRPDKPGTSRLSPHLHFGEISPHRCWHAVRGHDYATRGLPSRSGEAFLRELVWREFCYDLLFHWPDLPHAPFKPEFAAFPWRDDGEALRAWQKGLTGYPIVDAGMRELWHTGWMHNRVRMITASFLIKDLLVPWQQGEAWFWDTLVDADLANNSAGWQWVAGSGADASPYFRIFNPVLQGKKFDPEGAYVRRWVPELAQLDGSDIHAPWDVPETRLARAGIRLGATYPQPIVDHQQARQAALAAYEDIKR